MLRMRKFEKTMGSHEHAPTSAYRSDRIVRHKCKYSRPIRSRCHAPISVFQSALHRLRGKIVREKIKARITVCKLKSSICA